MLSKGDVLTGQPRVLHWRPKTMSHSTALSLSAVSRYDKIDFSLTIACGVGNSKNDVLEAIFYVPEWQTEGTHHEVLSMTSVGIRTRSDLMFLRIIKKFADIVASDDTGLQSDKQILHDIRPICIILGRYQEHPCLKNRKIRWWSERRE